MCVRIVCLTILALTIVGPSASRAQTQDDFAKVAEKLAPQIRQRITAKLDGQGIRVAVFPFGDAEGKITISMHEPNTVLQGELIFHLMKLAQGKYLVLDKAGLKKEFEAGGIDSAGVASNNPKNTAAVLNRIGVDVAVVGSIDAKSAAQVNKDKLTKINVAVTIIYKDGTADQLTGEGSKDGIVSPDTDWSGRFRVQLFLTGNGKPTEIPLLTSKEPSSAYYRVLFAEIPNNLAFGKESASYSIRISNKGTPAVEFDNARDKERLYGVAVLVDGVNSIYQDRGNGSIGPVVVHPRNARKWILSGPNHKLVPDNTLPKGYSLQRVERYGHSVIDIPGFQSNLTASQKFLFAPPRESIAETVGITNDIGVIAVHFYPEDLDGDVVPKFKFVQYPDLGTKPGPAVHNPIFRVQPKLKPNPVEVWRIFYRKKGDCPIKPDERLPIN